MRSLVSFETCAISSRSFRILSSFFFLLESWPNIFLIASACKFLQLYKSTIKDKSNKSEWCVCACICVGFVCACVCLNKKSNKCKPQFPSPLSQVAFYASELPPLFLPAAPLQKAYPFVLQSLYKINIIQKAVICNNNRFECSSPYF